MNVTMPRQPHNCSAYDAADDWTSIGVAAQLREEPMKSYPSLKKWWTSAEYDENTEWFLRQKKKNIGRQGDRREWDDYVVEEMNAKETAEVDQTLVAWEDAEMFVERKFPMKIIEVGGEFKKAKEELFEEFAAALADPDKGAKKIGDRWCLPRFAGGLSLLSSSLSW